MRIIGKFAIAAAAAAVTLLAAPAANAAEVGFPIEQNLVTVTNDKPGGGGPSGTYVTGGDNSVLGGNQVFAPISAPVSACGNAIAILGDARSC